MLTRSLLVLEVLEVSLQAACLALGEAARANQATQLPLCASEAEHNYADVGALHEDARST